MVAGHIGHVRAILSLFEVSDARGVERASKDRFRVALFVRFHLITTLVALGDWLRLVHVEWPLSGVKLPLFGLDFP
jgi:hypothetical protein